MGREGEGAVKDGTEVSGLNNQVNVGFLAHRQQMLSLILMFYYYIFYLYIFIFIFYIYYYILMFYYH